jgi:hypothetical protein
MVNPFEKRATEYLRDDEAFLSVVTPAPLFTYFEPRAKDGVLFDRLVVVVGTPGSGKTTIATLLQFKTLETLRHKTAMENHKDIVHALNRCGVMDQSRILVCGCRLALESEYRDFWELPYRESVKTGLMHSMLQARAIISWLRSLTDSGQASLEDVEVLLGDALPGKADQIGGTSGRAVYDRACLIEREIYRIGAALVPPKEELLPSLALQGYEPFEIIQSIRISNKAGSPHEEYRPLVILDDAHSLHPQQLAELLRWLAQREQRVARWVFMRLDAQSPQEALLDSFDDDDDDDAENPAPPKVAREVTTIWLQRKSDRKSQRSQFRTMGRQMADRYLRLIEIFSRNGVTTLTSVLNESAERLPPSKERELARRVLRLQEDLKITPGVRKQLEDEIDGYFKGAQNDDSSIDVKLSMLRIMMHRYARRSPQTSLFEVESSAEPVKLLSANSEIADGARIHLLHDYDRPYYFGIDALCDGASENAEIFLQLAGRLVSLAETRLIRANRNGVSLPSGLQHRELRAKANEIINDWRFPERKSVRRLVEAIAKECVDKALEPNASLGGGPNAIGIRQDEFRRIPTDFPQLAEVLKYAVGYNAVHIKRDHSTKHELWCLIELGGVALIRHGLSFRRGNFLERDVDALNSMLTRDT